MPEACVSCTNTCGSVLGAINALLGDVSISDAMSLILVKLSDIDAEIETLNKKISEAKAKIERAEEIDRILPEKNKELDAMIKRCFQYNTIAVTAKMTAALGAYKQYMGLFKAVYKPSKKDKPAEGEQNKQQETKAENKPAE